MLQHILYYIKMACMNIEHAKDHYILLSKSIYIKIDISNVEPYTLYSYRWWNTMKFQHIFIIISIYDKLIFDRHLQSISTEKKEKKCEWKRQIF